MATRIDEKNKNGTFAEKTERLIDPISVGTIHFIQQFNGLLPRPLQRIMMNATAKKAPLMGFVVEPYSSFLCYEITDTKKAQELLPDYFTLIKTRIFSGDDSEKYYCIIGSFRAHTSAFWGARTEFYVIAEDTRTGLLSWVIIDYDTNTISYDEKRGLTAPNSSSIITTRYDGELFVDVENHDGERACRYNFNVSHAPMKNLDQRLWLEGNLSVGYGKDLSTDGAVFSLRFETADVERALEIAPDTVHNLTNSWYSDIIADKPSRVVCFPYEQHFVSDSPGARTIIKNEQELVTAINSLDFSRIKPLSTKSLKLMFILGPIISFLVTATLLYLYITK